MGEKFALITDIHGNSSALKAVLADIKKEEGISHVFCLGDMLGIGHESDEVLDLLFSEQHISFVMGNHDRDILNILYGKEFSNKGVENEHHQWIAENIDKGFIDNLSKIPMKIEKEISGKTILFLHYHLFENNRFLPLDTEPTGTKLDEIYETKNIDIVCFGHHHTIHHFKTANRLYLNPGALGCGNKPLAPYGIVEIGDEGRVDVSFKEVPYDNSKFLRSIYKLKFPAYEIVLKNFHGNQHMKLI